MITSMLEGENFKPLMNYLPTGRTTSVSGCGVDDNGWHKTSKEMREVNYPQTKDLWALDVE